MYKLTINVTQENINSGECTNPSKCAIALAIRDVFPNALVGIKSIWFNEEDIKKFKEEKGIDLLLDTKAEGFASQTPTIAATFISDFDSKKRVEPISFDLEVPERYINSINIDEIKQMLTNHPNLTLHEKVLC